MKKGFGITTALLIFIIAFCIRGTAMSKENVYAAGENERYAALQSAFEEKTRDTLAEWGCPNSGITMTWIRKDGGRTYTVAIHHRQIAKLAQEDRERLVGTLLQEKFGGKECRFQIVLQE